MYSLNIQTRPRAPMRGLCVGAHSDDIEIGAGGLILSLLAKHTVEIDWVVFSGAPGVREKEARRSAAIFLKGARRANVIVKQFKDGFFPYDGAEVKAEFEGV